ncbi:SDR family NAD(P)-dependent oxidoreductase [Thermomonospora umbrina]|uniref:NAD(P)-dependent dehydrogenase (Short-subunit alcohol dehydrogenase family) n=1 Tax=Thermomonospora umbrina TaxID=111806 RepID=A0A3D9SZB0_9ACTN|nr:SDR family oxidoreductase [Thermomonospora umbrina]REE99900.1 NAD(P)-dependent dehydrogenase (short-subunit alcohol dehydrogenase family) [Thermomonospora umbrina]
MTENHRGAPSPTRRRLLAAGAAGAAAVPLAGLPGAAAGTRTPPAPSTGRADPNGRFAGKVVLITGATSGIGRATAYEMAREGAKVFFCGRRTELGRRHEHEIRKFGGDATYMRADVTREADVEAFVGACVRRHGRIDIAFNNAGIESPRALPLHEQSLRDLELVWRTNTAGVFLSMRHEIPHMLRRGRGVVVNTASISAEVGFATIAPYNSSKHGVASLTKVAALEYAARGIRVNALAPGAVDTPMLRRAAEAFGVTYEEIAQDYPIKRIVQPQEMARVVMWLASDDATAVTGTDVDASGGYLTG